MSPRVTRHNPRNRKYSVSIPSTGNITDWDGGDCVTCDVSRVTWQGVTASV